MTRETKPEIRISGGALEYRSAAGELIWTVQVDDIVLMAEYTTNGGPWLDDYFLVFVSIESERPIFATASFYGEGCDAVIEGLAGRWNADVSLSLASSTDWKSRIVWPPSLAEQEYFEAREVQPDTLWEKLRKAAFGPVYEYAPQREVRAFLSSRLGK